VIPVESSLLYVEPLYLLAERSELPELRRVLVAFGDSVAMENTMEEALESVFKAVSGTVRKADAIEDVESTLQDIADKTDDITVQALVEDAFNVYKEAGRIPQQRGFWRDSESPLPSWEDCLRS